MSQQQRASGSGYKQHVGLTNIPSGGNRTNFKHPHVKPYSPPQATSTAHSRARTFAASQSSANGNGHSTQSKLKSRGSNDADSQNSQRVESAKKNVRHIAANTISVQSGIKMSDLERTKSDLREVIWNQPVLFENPEYRRRVWLFIARTFYMEEKAHHKLQYDNYKYQSLSSETLKGAKNAKTKPAAAVEKTTPKKPESDPPSDPQRDGAVSNFDTDDSDDSEPITAEQLELYLTRFETYSYLIVSSKMQVVVERQIIQTMRNVLVAYAAANRFKFPLVASVQICAVLQVTTISEDSTFFLMQTLSDIMRPFRRNEEESIKNGALLLLDELCQNDEDLMHQLNLAGVDVVDLCMFVTSWVRALFAHHFFLDFVQRAIDLVLLEGPSVLIALAYGLVMLIRDDIKQSKNVKDVFDKFSLLKNFLKQKIFIRKVIAKAHELFVQKNYTYVQTEMTKKSWPDLQALPGREMFRIKRGVGDRDQIKIRYKKWRKQSRADLMKINFGVRNEEESESDSDPDATLHAENKKLKKRLTDLEGELDKFNKQGGSRGFTSMDVDAVTGHSRNASHNREQHSGQFSVQFDISSENLLSPDTTVDDRSKTPPPGSAEEKMDGNRATLSEMLHLSPNGDVAMAPIGDSYPIREVQCRTEDWTAPWKKAISTLTDASISMEGYLLKLTASRFNSKGTFDKIQKRWFVLRGCHLTYLKTHKEERPKGDKCINITGYHINPRIHKHSNYAFEMISPPQARLPPRKNKKSYTADFDYHPEQEHDPPQKQEHIKFVLMPEFDIGNEFTQKTVRDKWVKALRFASLGDDMWKHLLGVSVAAAPNPATVQTRPHSSSFKRAAAYQSGTMGSGASAYTTPLAQPSPYRTGTSHEYRGGAPQYGQRNMQSY